MSDLKLTTRNDLKDYDYVWLAYDRHQRIAAFITADSGVVPAQLAVIDIEYLPSYEEAALALPKITTAKLLVQVPRPDSYIALAERGLYVYDWDMDAKKHQQRFRLVAHPLDIAQCAQLPSELCSVAIDLSETNAAFSPALLEIET